MRALLLAATSALEVTLISAANAVPAKVTSDNDLEHGEVEV